MFIDKSILDEISLQSDRDEVFDFVETMDVSLVRFDTCSDRIALFCRNPGIEFYFVFSSVFRFVEWMKSSKECDSFALLPPQKGLVNT